MPVTALTTLQAGKVDIGEVNLLLASRGGI